MGTKKKKEHSIDQGILATFWDLAENEEQKRLDAIQTLVNALSLKQPANATEPSAEVVYTVKRLIKGLASDRGCARLGYAAALEQVVRRFPIYSILQLLELVENNLKYQKNDAKGEVSQMLIGRMTAFDSIIRASKVQEIDRDHLVKLIHNVVTNGVKKSFLGHMTIEILYEIISKFDKHEFKANVWPLIEKDLCKNWILEAVVTASQKSNEIRDGSQLLLAWSAFSIVNGSYKTSDGKYSKWAISTLVSLVAQASVSDPKWLLHLMQFFALSAFFEIEKPNSKIIHCEKEFANKVSPQLHDSLQNGFLKALGKLADTYSGKVSSIKTFVEFLVQLSSYIQLLVESSDISAIPDLREEDMKIWNRIQHTVPELQSQIEMQESDVGRAFLLLLLHQGLMTFLERTDSRENFDEIHSCYVRAFAKPKKSKAKNSSSEPLWIDVLVDVLMHLLLQESHLTRNIVKMASFLLHSEYTLTSIQLITQVLDARKGGDIGFDGDEEGDDDENEENENEVDGNEDDGNEDDEDEDVEDEEVEEGEVDADLRNRVKAALGGAAVPSDAEESLSDFDDDEMMKIDEMSAQILRQRAEISQKKTQLKEQEVQLRHYKLRCMDLVEDVARHTDSAAMLFELIMPLLKLLKTSRVRQEFQEIGGRAKRILNEIFQHHKLKDDKKLSADELQRAVYEIQTTMKSSDAGMSKEVARACLFVVHIALRFDDHAAGKMKNSCNDTEVSSAKNTGHPVIKDLILNFFQRKDSKMQPSFIKLLAEHYSPSVWCLKDELLGYILSSDVRIFSRTQACMLLSALMTPKLIAELDCNAEFAAKTKMAILELILRAEMTELKPKFAEQLLVLLMQCLFIDKGQTLEDIPKNFIEKVTLLKKISKDVRKQCNRLIGRLQTKRSAKQEKKSKRTEGSGKMKFGDTSPLAKRLRLDEDSKTKTLKQTKKSKLSKVKSVSNTEIIAVTGKLPSLPLAAGNHKRKLLKVR